MRFVLASSNAHKASEITHQLPGRFELVLQTSLGVESIPETGTTFLENALIKARHAAAVTGLPAIADDSGICVAALGGTPGIRSARYAGTDASDTANLEKLLGAMQGIDHRAAYFYCVLVCLNSPDDPVPLIAAASWHGEISHAADGNSGFGYDPIFFLPDMNCTAAALSMDEKNRISHRGQALTLLADQLIERFSD